MTMADNQAVESQSSQQTPEQGKTGIDKEKVAQIIEIMREALQADGGDIELIGIDDDGTVSVELTGTCAACSLSSYDLSMGVERVLKERVPGVTRVQAI